MCHTSLTGRDPDAPRPTRYEDDPRWQAASDAFAKKRTDLPPLRARLRQQAALHRMLEIDLEYEPRPMRPACRDCSDSGRTAIDGPERHCSCSIGRAMARAHWAEKAAEEAWA